MYLVLAEANDSSAVWGFQQLLALKQRVEFITPGELVAASRWSHRVGDHAVESSLTLRRGLTVASSEVTGVLNRVAYLAPFLFQYLRESDRFYASQEVTALFFSWLHGMRVPVLNPPTGMGLGGAWRHDSEWAVLAAKAGLEVRSFRQSSRDAAVPRRLGLRRKSVLLIGKKALGFSVPGEVAAGALELARLAKTPILALDFEDHGSAKPWVFVSATPQPNLQQAGHEAIRALMIAWETGRKERAA